MKEFNEIDQLFKERAENFEIQVPQDAWSKISTSMQVKARRNRYIWFTSVAALLVVGCSVALTVLTLNSISDGQTSITSNKIGNEVVNPTSEVKTQQFSQSNEQQSHSVTSETKNTLKVSDESISTQSKTIKQNTVKTIPQRKTKSTIANLPVINLVSDAQEPSPINSATVATNENSIAAANNENHVTTEITNSSVSLADDSSNKLTQTPISLEEVNPTKTLPNTSVSKTWIAKIMSPNYVDICYSLGVSYNYRNKIKTDIDTKVAGVSNNDDWLNTWSNQVLIQFGYNNRLRFGTGIKMGSFGNVSNFETNDAYLNYLKVDEFGVSSSGIITAHRINNIISNSSSTISTLNKFDRIKFQFYYLDIPLNIAYKFQHSSKLSSELGTGINFMNIYKNVVDLRKDNEWYYLGNVTNLRKYVFGANLNYDVIYLFSNRLSALIGVNYQASFNSVNLDKNFIYRPYLFTFKVGGRYRF